MSRPTRFNPVSTPHGWRINVPAKFTESGRRERHFYRTQKLALAAAVAFKAKVAEHGTQAKAIPPSLAERATAAAELLKPYGVDLLEAARIVVAIRQREEASKPLDAAVDLWLLDCEGLRPKTQAGYRQTAKRLKDALGARLLASVTGEELQAALITPGTPPTAAAGHLRTGRAFWNWCAERGWCQSETFAAVKLPKTSKEAAEIEILAPEEAANLLATAAEHFPQAVASYALQLFAGIRAEEITRLESKHVSTEGIDLPAIVTKKGRRRHITPSATLRAWLAKHPFAPCPNWKRVDRACRYLAGWKLAPDPDLVPKKLVRDKEKQEACREWPQNALRHSHASYAVSAGVPLESLLFEFGHAGSPNLLRQHYVGRASKAAALEYFAIMPEGMEAPANLQTVEAVA